MKKIVRGALCFCALFLLLQLQAAENPKYVFLFIGDGMGKPHVDLARQVFGKLFMDQLPVRGSVSTVNAKKQTTDSAASGTAFACGVKTINGRLGIDANGKAVDSSAVLAKKQGRRAAVLTTVGLNNATPAAFYAHVMKRGESKKIMEQFPASGIDILCGEGIDGMNSKVRQEDFLTGKAYLLGGKQGDADALKGTGIRVIAKQDQPFFDLKKLTGPVLVYSRNANNLSAYVQKAIELMQDSPKGFFMMAEGGHIDHGGHGNNVFYMLSELQKFDAAVGVALQFYRKHPKETLIVVSADHHTGGLVLADKVDRKNLMKQNVTVHKNDTPETLKKNLAAVGIVCTDAEMKKLNKAAQAPKERKKALQNAVRSISDAHAGIRWKTKGHTMDEVYLFAIGTGAEKFAGRQENSDVGAKLKSLFRSGK